MIYDPKVVPKCPSCDKILNFVSNGYKSENEGADIYVELKGYCLNPICPNYAGRKDGDKIVINTDSPVAETIRNKVG